MKTVLMVVFLLGFIVSVLEALTDKPDKGQVVLWMMIIILNFMGIMYVMYYG